MAKSTEVELRHPRDTTRLYGHADAERTLLEAYRSGRMPHAWLIAGPRGIGKATLAYRLVRFVLANPDPKAPQVRNATSLDVDEASEASRRFSSKAHGGLLVLERTLGDSGAMRTVITVEQVRETVSFFGSTAAADGWRVCVVDSADELKSPEAPNALLKILEEPPARALFLLVTHNPGRLLPTIRSRCRMLMLRALNEEDVAPALASAADVELDDTVRRAAAASEGSVARARLFLGEGALGLHQRLTAMLEALPAVDPQALHALGDMLAGADRAPLTIFVDTIDRWLTERVRGEVTTRDARRLARIAEVWEKFGRSARETEIYNLERKPLVFQAFGMLDEVARA